MNKSVTVLGAALAICLSAAPSHAQATRTWVTGAGGSDANPCSRTAPCQTFAGAISKTAVNGIINCIDAGAYGAVTITKSITIDCHEQTAGVLASSTTGIVINLTTAVALDPFQTVRLRNLNIDGSGSCGAGCGTRTGIRGINILSAKEVHVEDMFIQNFVNEGIRDARTTTGGRLYVVNSIIRDNTGSGIAVAARGRQLRQCRDRKFAHQQEQQRRRGGRRQSSDGQRVGRQWKHEWRRGRRQWRPEPSMAARSPATPRACWQLPDRRSGCPTTTSGSTEPASPERRPHSATTASIRLSAPFRHSALRPPTTASSNLRDAASQPE